MKNYITYFIAALFLVSSCVTPKIYNDLLSEHERSNNKLVVSEKKVLELNNAVREKEEKILF